MLKKYRFGFDIFGLLLFLLVMIPNGEKMAVSAEDFSTTGKIWYKVTYHEVEGWVSDSQVK